MMARPSSQHSASFFLARCSLRGARWRHGGGRSHLRGVLRVPTLGGRRCVPVARRHRGRPRAHALLRPRGGRDDCGLRPMRRDNLLARSRRGGSLPEVQSLRHRRARPTPTDRDPASSSTSPTRAARASRADNSANSSYTILASEVSATRARWARDTRCSTSARDAEACRESHTLCGATNPRRARSATSRGRATSRATTTPRGEYIRTTRARAAGGRARRMGRAG